MNQKATFSIPSIISLVAAIFSFSSGAVWGFVLAGVAVIFGILGVLLSLSPKVRGGFISILGVLGGGLGVLAAVIKGVMAIAS